VDIEILVPEEYSKCDKCKQRQVRVARREYITIGDDVKTKFAEDKN
jgi:hypothetical protein